MLSAWEAIRQRRSIRKYTNDDVPDDLINQILEAADLHPQDATVSRGVYCS